jgi:hypothetical protein
VIFFTLWVSTLLSQSFYQTMEFPSDIVHIISLFSKPISSYSEDEEEIIATISSKTEELLRLGRAFWEEQRRGNTMKWGDWCDEEEE